MTLNVAVGGIGQSTYAKPGDRFAAGAEPGDTGFEEALAAKFKRNAPDADLAEADSDSSWAPQSYTSSVGYGVAPVVQEGNLSGEDEAGQIAFADGELPDTEEDVLVVAGDVPPTEQQTVLTDAAASPNPATVPLPGSTVPDESGDGTAKTQDEPLPPSADEALLAAQQRQAASQSQSMTDAKAAPIADANAAAAQAAQLLPAAERQGDQRGRTAQPSGGQAPVGAVSDGEQNQTAAATAQPDALDRLVTKVADKDVVRFIPAREQLAQGNNQPKSPPPANTADALNGQVKVVGYSAALAPSPTIVPLLGNTSASVVAAIEGDHTWRAAAAESGALVGQRAQSLSTGVNTLKIQLQPIELGMVTARLSTSGTQLSVEIQVESNDARQKLANDSDAIVKALRGLGFDIDKVTIQQAPQTSQPSTPTAQQGGSGREQFTPNQQAQGEASGRGQGGERSTNARGGERVGQGPGEAAADRAGSSLYI